MDDATLNLFIGVGGTIAGALAAAAANMYSASRKIKEVKLAYAYKLQDGYLENARKLSGEVYVPINVQLTALSSSYEIFRARVNFDANEVPEGSFHFFVGQCRNYLSEIDKLFQRGADAYLTNEMDKRLREFNSFIRESVSAKELVVKNVFEASASMLPFALSVDKFEQKSRSRIAPFVPKFSISLAGFGLGYSKEVLAAPLQSRTFEKRFQTDTLILKSLIKEVKLGSHSRA
jgi:hypothetical protein